LAPVIACHHWISTTAWAAAAKPIRPAARTTRRKSEMRCDMEFLL
jgi:hypothetical protein